MTIALDEATARWARVEAARRDTSLSEFLGAMLRERMAEEGQYESAMRAYLDRSIEPLKKRGGYPSRASLHERADLR